MDTLGTHLLVELYSCDADLLNCVGNIEQSMRAAASAANATIVSSQFHHFGPQGVSGVLVLAESHLSVHTWPEHRYAAVDIYTCGPDCKPELAHEVLAKSLGALSIEVLEINRGREAGQPTSNSQGIGVGQHRRETTRLSILGSGERVRDECSQSGQGLDRARPWPE